ncbi:hypothetical protein DFH29DRAFT_262810 [Suillus ampliporus]|nr:hypothetical protein DFH29DRAFT_262810 [Suillus ampliporus]
MYRLIIILNALRLCAIIFPGLSAPTRLSGTATVSHENRVTRIGEAWRSEAGSTGACRYTDTDSDPASVVAISAQICGTGGNCNQWIEINNTENGKTAYG